MRLEQTKILLINSTNYFSSKFFLKLKSFPIFAMIYLLYLESLAFSDNQINFDKY